MEPILHPEASNPHVIDIHALVYSLLRLPECIDQTHKIILAQTPEIFANAGYPDIQKWSEVRSHSRRRISYFNSSKKILAVFAGSISDVDDLVNILIAYQHQWNRIHDILHKIYPEKSKFLSALKKNQIPVDLNISPENTTLLIASLGKKKDQSPSPLYLQSPPRSPYPIISRFLDRLCQGHTALVAQYQ
jgi:hypothetical protein